MKAFTFLYHDWTQDDVEAEDVNEAFQKLCDRKGRAWSGLASEVLDSFVHVPDGIERE